MSYAEKLKDPRWQKRRLQILERDSFTCAECLSKEKELHVHHRCYHSGKDPWDYVDSELISLCKPCHEKRGNLDDRIYSLLGTVPYPFLEEFAGFLDYFQKFEAAMGRENKHFSNTTLAIHLAVISAKISWSNFITPELASSIISHKAVLLDHFQCEIDSETKQVQPQ